MTEIEQIKIIDQIKRIPNVLTKEECSYLIHTFDVNQDKLFTEASLKFLDKESKLEYKSDNFKAISLMDGVDDKALSIAAKGIKTMIINYLAFQKINFSKLLTSDFYCSSDNIRILRYQKDEEIMDHLDLSEEIRMSCTLNLNEDYDGGDFSFFHGKYKIKLKQGEGMIFPAEPHWIHGVEKVTAGSRYSINCFLKRYGKIKLN